MFCEFVEDSQTLALLVRKQPDLQTAGCIINALHRHAGLVNPWSLFLPASLPTMLLN